MKSKKSSIHRGEILRQAINKSGVSITVAVKRAGYSRSSYYYHIQDPNLDFETLRDYGKVIRHDFSIDIPDMEKLQVEDEREGYIKPANLEQAQKEIEKWQQKYYSLLEKHQKLLEEKIKR